MPTTGSCILGCITPELAAFQLCCLAGAFNSVFSPRGPRYPCPQQSVKHRGAADTSETLVKFAERGVGSQDRPADRRWTRRISLSSDCTDTTNKISILLALPSTSEASPPPLSPRQGFTT